jgi:hypothetical protein
MGNKLTKFLVVCFVFVHMLSACSSPSPTNITPGSILSSTATLDTKSSNTSSVQVTKDKAHERESQALAERGVLVFTINWLTPNTDLAWKDDGMDFRMMAEAHICAIRFARARAPDYGGDPTQVVLVAFSMGARIGITAALAGDDLPVLWEDFATKRGGPPSQIDCVEGKASANVKAFVGIGGRYNSVDYLKTESYGKL